MKLKLILAMVMTLGTGEVESSEAGVREEARKIANLLRASRAVISKRKNVIKAPKKIPKYEKFIALTSRNFILAHGARLQSSLESDQFLQSINEVIDNAKAGVYNSKWSDTPMFRNRFLPARYAREVSNIFSDKTDNKVTLKLTAPERLLVNPANKPDAWEVRQIAKLEGLQRDPDWLKNKEEAVLFEQVGDKCRYLFPEFYNNSCMGCHGGEQGRKIHFGKVEGVQGQIGGAISITFHSKSEC